MNIHVKFMPGCRFLFLLHIYLEVKFLKVWLCVLISQLCPTLCNSMDCSPSGSFVHGILQARILESVALSFSRGSSQNKDWTQVSHIAGKLFTIWATREASRWHKCPNKKAGREIFVFILWTHSKKAAIFQTAGILNKTQSCHHTDLRLPISRTVGK